MAQTVKTNKVTYSCGKLAIGAGHGSQRLLTLLGQKLHIYPQRGQLLSIVDGLLLWWEE